MRKVKELSLDRLVELIEDNIPDPRRPGGNIRHKKSEKLMSIAKENLRSVIEAWYSPVLDGYTFEIGFSAPEGGETK